MSNELKSFLSNLTINVFRCQHTEGRTPIEFSISKDEKVKALFSGYKKGVYDIRFITAKKPKSQEIFMRISLALDHADGKKRFFNGAFFTNAHKVQGDQKPNYTGVLNLDQQKNGEKMAMSVWLKTSDNPETGKYYTVRFREFRTSVDPLKQGHEQSEYADHENYEGVPA